MVGGTRVSIKGRGQKQKERKRKEGERERERERGERETEREGTQKNESLKIGFVEEERSMRQKTASVILSVMAAGGHYVI